MNREILRLAIPNIVSNVSVPLLSTVDTALMGRLSELHLGAVGVGAMIFNFLYWNFGFLRMGTTGLTAQAYGKREEVQMIVTLCRALLVALVLAALMLILQYPIGELSVILMNAGGEQADLIRRYFYIRIWAAPATLSSYAFLGWFFGMQNAVYPLVLTILVNVVNIAVSFVLVHYLGMDVDGVAYGTLIAQYAGMLSAMALFYHKYRYLFKIIRREAVLNWLEFRRFFKINADIFIRTLCLSFAFGFFYSRSTAAGEMVLAVNVILLQYLNWMSYAVDGFAFASESLVGKYKGRQDEALTAKAVRYSFSWGMGLAILFSLCYLFFGESLLWVFTTQEEVVTRAVPYLIWMVIFPLLSTPCYIWDGVFIGLTASRAMRNSMLLAISIYLAGYYLVEHSLGNHGLWLVLLIFMAARGLFQYLLYCRRGWTLD